MGTKNNLIDFRPTDVDLLGSFPPLVATMGRSETEGAAAMLVRTMQARGDEWRAVTPREIGEVLHDDLAAAVEPWHSLKNNPFFRPDIYDLVKRGCAEWPGEPGKDCRFTAKGLEAMRRHVQPRFGEATRAARAFGDVLATVAAVGRVRQ